MQADEKEGRGFLINLGLCELAGRFGNHDMGAAFTDQMTTPTTRDHAIIFRAVQSCWNHFLGFGSAARSDSLRSWPRGGVTNAAG